ncbi:zinc finger protein 1-like isoform X2 [Littorina saxatilis]|uniref:zinc finger protein 1-like isoform X2 n=1 Tax=Littorina saxatilis TaxID=31220 RepID=UPI0038B60447
MAEVEGRCGRRKQRNPRRKNAVDNDDQCKDPSLGVDVESGLPTKKRSPSNDSTTTTTTVEEIREEKSEDKKENSLSFSNANFDPVAKRDDLPKGDKPVVKESNEREEKTEEDVPPTPVQTEKDDDKPEDRPEERKEECSQEGKEGIEKMLASGDTVVIYPEPVSDHDDAENHEDLQTTADEDYILKCVHCSETFTRASLLRDHMRANHPDLPVKYQCPKCDDTFPLKSHLDKHLALHSPTSQVCKVCNKTFANVYRLQRHMISHDESTDLRKFKCPTCAKAFKFKHHLKEHIRIHSGEKPFECANCGKRFSHSGSYSSHMNSKKCWVLNMKGKRLDRNAHPENANGMMFRPVGYTSGNVNAPLQSPPPGAYPGQFLKYDARGPMVPTLYSPPSTRAEFVAAYSMLMAGKHLPLPAHHHPPPSLMPSLAPPPLPVPITCPKPSELSSSPASVRSQISPDVNFNTQLFNMALNKASKDLVMKVKEMEEKEGMRKDVKKEAEKEMEVEEEGEKVEGDEKVSTENAVCRHCHNKFNSPVELHQHERYLCKLNKDISQLMPSSIPPPTTTTTTTSPTTTPDNTSNNCASPGSTISDRSRHATPSSSLCDTATEDEEDEGGNSDRKKYRMRSLISDDQQKVLKAHYRENPRPDKEELVRIATEVGFSKRVVQVWFQNMRARDRRHGKEVPYFPNMARFKPNDSSNNNSTTTTNNNNSSVPTTTATTGLCVPAYIPIVPQVFTTSPLATQSKYSSLRGLPTPTSATGELPLDLSFRRQPPKAHSNSSSPAPSSSPFNCQDQALNLSTKAPSTPIKEEPTSKSEQEVRATESRDVNVGFQHSSIFKYLQQEGLFKNPLKVPKPEDISKLQSTAERLQIASTIRSKLLARKSQSPPLPKPNGLIKEEVKTDDVVADQSERSEEKAASSPGKDSQPEDLDLSGESRLVIDESGLEKEDEDMDNEDEGDDSTDDEDGDDEEDETSDAASKQAFVDQHNLETLATVATLEELKQHLEGGSGKSKRLRRKSRQQMESEDFIMDLDDAVSTEDEDGPQRKRRKSWKGHKVDAELGMYACDQCDKMFSKQSSLARHKYEHSGARPFTCEVCDKAFKHKHHLTEHRRLHSGEKPFQCKKCGKRFSHSGSYSQHMNHRYKYCKPSDTEDE